MKQIVIPTGRRLTADDSIYGVRVIGDERPDGRWDVRVEFQSGSGIRLSTHVGADLNSYELRNRAAQMGEETLREALTRASEGPIERADSTAAKDR